MTGLLLALLVLDVQGWMLHSFYPVLLLVLLVASLGVPIPEDVPLLAAGVILSHQPDAVSWTGAIAVSLIGIMCGDVILYVMGGVWGPDVYRHRWVNRLITPQRLAMMTEKFHRHGLWMCFFGRFFMGIRAAMCITAGVTRLSFWKFLLADFAGALLSAPLLIWLGYWFAGMLPTVKAYVHLVQWILLGLALAALAGFILYRRLRPIRNRGGSEVPKPLPTETRPTQTDLAIPRPIEQKPSLRRTEQKTLV
jgi:membrane protein DedA with SNARE-associated domain